MTAVASIKPSGSIVRLWRSKAARSVIVQIVAMAVVLSLVAIGLHNVAANLEAIGKEFSFDFLAAPAAYDITFSPFIDYSSRDMHLTAAAVGILNTLLVAVCGIVAATLLGFTMGVLRLSGNWLISRMVYVFIEFTRNVPLLLHILLVHGILVTTLPTPRKAIGLGDTMFLSNRGLYVPSPVLEDGAGVVGAVLLIAIVAAIAFRRWAKRRQDETGKIYPVFRTCAGMIVGATAVAFLATAAPLSWDVPELGGFNFRGGMALKPEFLALWLALSYHNACFIAEIVRAGILAVSHGQTETSYALGLRPNRTLQLVVIPQALRIIVPPMGSQYLLLTKDSSLAIAIGYMDVVATIGGISLMQTGKEVETMIIVLGVYLVFSLTISAFMNWFNRSIRFRER